MKYLIGFSESEAVNISSQTAILCGCNNITTKYWFYFFKHVDRDEWAIMVKDEDLVLLTEEEINELVEHDCLVSDGWFGSEGG